MPAILRSRFAVVALFVVFLIPVLGSSLRGRTHVLTCVEQVGSPFQVILVDGEAIVTGSAVVDADDDGTLCGGLAVRLGAGPSETGDVDVIISIENRSPNDWFGSIDLEVVGIRVPVDIGRIRSGTTERAAVPLTLPEGVSEFGGELLVGP